MIILQKSTNYVIRLFHEYSTIQLDKRVNQLDDGAGEEVERDQVGDGNDGG